MARSHAHLIRSQPAASAQPPPPAQETTNTNTEELQQTIDDLLSQVSIPQIRSAAVATKQDGRKQRGTIRKLGQLVPNQAIQPSPTTVSGHRLARPRNPLPTGTDQGLVLTISRKTPFSVYLKRALAHLRKPAAGPLLLRAMGCALSMAFSLAMAVESNLNLASPAVLHRALSTGTVVVGDELTPKSSNAAVKFLCPLDVIQHFIDY
ncbi:hypothetical protein PtB15_15B402 [Puccinia triticina]|nr:hypothetical protein PtB15_15B402 [Puccinia triticina]